MFSTSALHTYARMTFCTCRREGGGVRGNTHVYYDNNGVGGRHAKSESDCFQNGRLNFVGFLVFRCRRLSARPRPDASRKMSISNDRQPRGIRRNYRKNRMRNIPQWPAFQPDHETVFFLNLRFPNENIGKQKYNIILQPVLTPVFSNPTPTVRVQSINYNTFRSLSLRLTDARVHNIVWVMKERMVLV